MRKQVKNEFVSFVGPMFGGKTTKLLSVVDRYKFQKREIFAFKPNVDKRYREGSINTHWGGRLEAELIDTAEDIYSFLYAHKALLDDNPVIAVDEAFMLPGSGVILPNLFKKGATIVVSTLQLSSDGSAFKEVERFLPYSTKIEVCPAVCSVCGSDAFYTKKIGGRDDHEIEVGGAEMYQPVCIDHFIY